MYQYTKKRASGPKCPVTGKKIQGVCSPTFLLYPLVLALGHCIMLYAGIFHFECCVINLGYEFLTEHVFELRH